MERERDVSYSAGVAFLWMPYRQTPKLLLVLERGGERNRQTEGEDFVEPRVWKMPGGHYDPNRDRDLVDTAVREFIEETGRLIRRDQIDIRSCFSVRIRSKRPGSIYHEDVVFLVKSKEEPRRFREPGANTEEDHFFPVYDLPTGALPEDRGAELSLSHRVKFDRLKDKLGMEFPELAFLAAEREERAAS
jgi:ADP-ribose pyrophosphatase YjhB (NUDIX family)